MNQRVHPQVAGATEPAPSASPLGSPADTWPNRACGEVCTAVLQISGMPRSLRPAIERAMARCIRSESEFIVPGDDPLTAQWCTRWRRDPLWDVVGIKADNAANAAKGVDNTGVGIGCQQVLTGTPSELEALGRAVEMLAGEYGFRGVVKRAV
ncbi:hypothetical protein FQN05_00145 [Corynebacterium aurimucosum]|uniref:Uncharacterized protein n=1 Tax=Corynebacterium aurimucosum TaxID=169292 RepID=A0A558IZ87_9CORY|nr:MULTISPECIES: hypothetical protein [Corynebacterium]OFN34216.1 hypothetical protein HMPREF2565_10700 [Corynebacterium sp. HMSC072A04]TVU86676.1 hypothetical protein FQN05_00145 [Corynebacterium aurimucosum]